MTSPPNRVGSMQAPLMSLLPRFLALVLTPGRDSEPSTLTRLSGWDPLCVGDVHRGAAS